MLRTEIANMKDILRLKSSQFEESSNRYEREVIKLKDLIAEANKQNEELTRKMNETSTFQ